LPDRADTRNGKSLASACISCGRAQSRLLFDCATAKQRAGSSRPRLGRCRYGISESSRMFLSGKRALVTGSTSGIGLAIARALHAEGAEVVLSGLGDAEEIAKLSAELGARHVGGDL